MAEKSKEKTEIPESKPEAAAKAPKAAKTALKEKTEGGKPKKEKETSAAAPVEAAALVADVVEGGEAAKPKIIKAKGSKNVVTGIAHIMATFNNTVVSITDLNGNVIGWSSAGRAGFRGSRKSTAYAAQLVAQDAARQAMGHGLREVQIQLKGPGSGREAAVRALSAIGLEITSIRDVTPVPHNGCRPRKRRRV